MLTFNAIKPKRRKAHNNKVPTIEWFVVMSSFFLFFCVLKMLLFAVYCCQVLSNWKRTYKNENNCFSFTIYYLLKVLRWSHIIFITIHIKWASGETMCTMTAYALFLNLILENCYDNFTIVIRNYQTILRWNFFCFCHLKWIGAMVSGHAHHFSISVQFYRLQPVLKYQILFIIITNDHMQKPLLSLTF